VFTKYLVIEQISVCHYIRQVNGVKLADILFSLLCVCVHVQCTLIFRCKYLENHGLRSRLGTNYPLIEMACGGSNDDVIDDITWPWKVKVVIPISLRPVISKTAPDRDSVTSYNGAPISNAMRGIEWSRDRW